MSADPGMSESAARAGDFAGNHRLIILSLIALVIGVISTAGAMVLLAAIRLFTNLFFFQTASLNLRSPAANHLGPIVIVIPAIGGLIVGLMARFGTEKIRGHGIPRHWRPSCSARAGCRHGSRFSSPCRPA
jgi:H+/Cl- antiporter ClcA